MSESSRAPSACQTQHIITIRSLVVQPKKIKDQLFIASKQILFSPLNYMGEKPNPKTFYLKPVIVCAPTVTFPDVKFHCIACKSDYRQQGWCPTDRYVEGLTGGFYVTQLNYKCKCVSDLYISGLQLIHLDSVPPFVSQSYPIMTLHRTAYHNDLVAMICSDALSQKSFEAIANSIGIIRSAEYLRKRAIYVSAVDFWGKKTSLFSDTSAADTCAAKTAKSFEEFSAMDDILLYNESRFISPEMCIAVFEGV